MKYEENYAVRFGLTIKKQFFIFSRLLEKEKNSMMKKLLFHNEMCRA